MDPRQELELRRKIESARKSGDQKAYLQNRAQLERITNPSKIGIVPYPNDPLASYNADTNTGAPFKQRAAASVKMTPQGKVGYLRSIYGDQNVATREDGQIFYRKPGVAKWTQFDEPGMTLSDLADMTGGATEAVPAIGAGMMTANPLAVGLGGAAGNAMRQGISAALPGNDQMTPMQRAASVGIAGGTAGLAQGGANLLSRGFDYLRPHNLVARRLQRGTQSDVGRRGAQLEREMGNNFRFTPGQKSGGRGQLMLEGLARRHPASADMVAKFDISQAEKATARMTKLMDDLARDRPGPITVGFRVRSAYDNALNAARKARTAQASSDIQKLTEVSGDQPVFALNNLVKEIDDLVNQYHTPVGGDTANRTVKALMELRRQITGSPPGAGAVERGMVPHGQPSGQPPLTLTPRQFQRTLEIYGKAARGDANILRDIDSASTNRTINQKLFSALQRDLDSAANAEGVTGETAAALKAFRDHYRANSEQIDALGNNVLGRLFGTKTAPPPEKVADSFLKMKPSEIQMVRPIIEKADPEAMQAVKYHMLSSAMDNAVPSGSGAKAGFPPISPAKFNSFLNKHKDQFLSTFKPAELVQVKRIYETMGRLADRGGSEGSPTAPLQFALDLAKGMVSVNPIDTVRAGVMVLGPRKIARAMTTDQGRRALLTVMHTKKPTRASIAAAGYLGKIIGDEVTNVENVAPLDARNGQ